MGQPGLRLTEILRMRRLPEYLGGLYSIRKEVLPTFSISQRAWMEEMRAHYRGVLLLWQPR